MATPLSDERLAEIRERCDKATQGPWAVDEESGDVWVPSIWRSVAIIEDLDLPLVNPAADRAFIAAARQDVPALLDEVERLRSWLRECDAAIGGDGSDESLLGLVYTCGAAKDALAKGGER